MSVTLGEKIRGLREKKDISLRELARLVDISPSFMSDIELGRRNPSKEILEKIANKLGTSLNDLELFDKRTTLAEINQLMTTNPRFGIAFRRVLEEKLSPDELMKIIEDQKKKKQ